MSTDLIHGLSMKKLIVVVLFAIGLLGISIFMFVKKKESYTSITTGNNWTIPLSELERVRETGAQTLYGDDTRDRYTKIVDRINNKLVVGNRPMGHPIISASGVLHDTSAAVLPIFSSPNGPIQYDARTGMFRELTTSQRGDSSGLAMKKMRRDSLDTEERLEFARMERENEVLSLFGNEGKRFDYHGDSPLV